MAGNRRGTRAVARGRLTGETEGERMLGHRPRRLGQCVGVSMQLCSLTGGFSRWPKGGVGILQKNCCASEGYP